MRLQCAIAVFVLCGAIGRALAGASPTTVPPPTDLHAFRDAIWNEFLSLHAAAVQLADRQTGIAQGALPATAPSPHAVDVFRMATERNWPYPTPRNAVSEAAAALQAAETFERERYMRGQGSREEAVAKYIAVAEQFPDSPEHDRALRFAALLYTQRARAGVARDDDASAAILRRLRDRPGPPSPFTIHAAESLAGYTRDPVARMKERSEFYESLQRWQDPRELRELLAPSARTTPREFASNVWNTLVTIRTSQVMTARNMVADAALSRDPVANLRWLRDRYASDPVVMGEIERGLRKVRPSETGLKVSEVAPSSAMPIDKNDSQPLTLAAETPDTRVWWVVGVLTFALVILAILAAMLTRRLRLRHLRTR